MKWSGRRLSAWLALPLAACGGDTMVAGEHRAVDGFVIAPYEIHQECMSMAEGDRLDYRFEATAPVAFDIRYREGVTVISTVSREGVREAAGIFAARASQLYCAHWEAGRQGAIVDFRLRFLAAGASP